MNATHLQRSAWLMALVITASSSAASEVERWYFVPTIGRIHADDARNAESDDELYGLGFGKHLTSRWSVELNATAAHAEGFAPRTWSVDGLRVFRRESRVAPYAIVGLGAQRDRISGGADDGLAEAGAGLFFKLGESRRRSGAFSLRPQVVARWSDGGDLVDYVATVGAQFSFGRATTPTPAPTRQSVSETNVAPAADEHVMTHPTVTTPSCEAPADCEPAVPLVLVRVLFDTDSVAIRPEFEPQLERATEALRKHARVAIELQGHTDDRGTEAYNLALSERRAAVVREYLLARGVDSARVAFVGLGERQPAADNRTLEGRAANRRVEMHVTSNPDGVAVTE